MAVLSLLISEAPFVVVLGEDVSEPAPLIITLGLSEEVTNGTTNTIDPVAGVVLDNTLGKFLEPAPLVGILASSLHERGCVLH